jgi:uncharacterized membrane protein YfcA
LTTGLLLLLEAAAGAGGGKGAALGFNLLLLLLLGGAGSDEDSSLATNRVQVEPLGTTSGLLHAKERGITRPLYVFVCVGGILKSREGKDGKGA